MHLFDFVCILERLKSTSEFRLKIIDKVDFKVFIWEFLHFFSATRNNRSMSNLWIFRRDKNMECQIKKYRFLPAISFLRGLMARCYGFDIVIFGYAKEPNWLIPFFNNIEFWACWIMCNCYHPTCLLVTEQTNKNNENLFREEKNLSYN